MMTSDQLADIVFEMGRQSRRRGGLVGRCSIYEDRPDLCKAYPVEEDVWVSLVCTHGWVDGVRVGECDSRHCKGLCCCALPREGGEPDGRVTPFSEGGVACRHLVWRASTGEG